MGEKHFGGEKKKNNVYNLQARNSFVAIPMRKAEALRFVRLFFPYPRLLHTYCDYFGAKTRHPHVLVAATFLLEQFLKALLTTNHVRSYFDYLDKLTSKGKRSTYYFSDFWLYCLIKWMICWKYELRGSISRRRLDSKANNQINRSLWPVIHCKKNEKKKKEKKK